MKPVRLQLSRRKGFSLQELSRATNGLYAVNVARPSRWGNPYSPACGIGYGYFDEKMQPVHYNDHDPAQCVHMFKFRMRDMKRDRPADFEAFIDPLRWRNLACWCKPDAPCHADVLLELAMPEAQAA